MAPALGARLYPCNSLNRRSHLGPSEADRGARRGHAPPDTSTPRKRARTRGGQTLSTRLSHRWVLSGGTCLSWYPNPVDFGRPGHPDVLFPKSLSTRGSAYSLVRLGNVDIDLNSPSNITVLTICAIAAGRIMLLVFPAEINSRGDGTSIAAY